MQEGNAVALLPEFHNVHTGTNDWLKQSSSEDFFMSSLGLQAAQAPLHTI